MTTGMMDLITISGLMTPIDMMPTPDFAVPYAAPRFAKMIAEERPMKPKKADDGSQTALASKAKGAVKFYNVATRKK